MEPQVFTYKPPKQPKVIRRKLGKERVWGTSEEDKRKTDSRIIEIDERLRGKRELEILLHEKYHLMYPQLSEEEIIIRTRDLTEFLWGQHYRKIDPSED